MSLIPLASQTAPDSSDYSGSRLVNLYAHPSEGKSPLVLYGRSGLVQYVDLGTGRRVRAMLGMGGALYAVSGGKVFKVASGAATQVGEVNDDETYLASSGDELAIVAGGAYYICDGTSTVKHDTGAVDIPRGVTYLDGYFIVIGQVAGRDDGFTISALDDGTSFDASEFAFAESGNDALVGLIADHNELWLFGSETTELFYNSGNALFPFTPNKGAMIEDGCLSGKSLAKADNAVFWVTPDGKVGRSFGGAPEWVSPPEIQGALAGSTILGAFTFRERGHEFYAIIREQETALVFDLATRLWHERAGGTDYDPWGVYSSCEFKGVEYFGTDAGIIATASEAAFTDLGQVLATEVVTPLQVSRGKYYRVSKVHLDIASGGVDIGRDAKVMLQTTKDGVNWSPEKWRDLGGAGVYSKRAVWHALGAFREGALRVRITDPVTRDIIGMAIDAAPNG